MTNARKSVEDNRVFGVRIDNNRSTAASGEAESPDDHHKKCEEKQEEEEEKEKNQTSNIIMDAMNNNVHNNMDNDNQLTKKKSRFFSLSPPWLLSALCLSGIVQGMIFSNVVISTLERRFGLHSAQSGLVAGSYDLGSLLAVIPITYYGGRSGAHKSRFIAVGMVVMGIGSLIFALPHFTTKR